MSSPQPTSPPTAQSSPRRLLGALALAAAAALGATPGRTSPTYYADVKPIIDGRCTGCHVTDGIAPFPLTTYDEVLAHRRGVASATAAHRMPPWPASPGVGYSNDASLTPEQIATIRSWLDAGAPAGDPALAGPALPHPGNGLSRVDLTLGMPEPYTPTVRPDEYRCFVVDWPYTDTRYVAGFGVTPGNPRIVHHMIAYLVQPADAAEARRLEAEDAEPGYECFGDARIDHATWLAVWAPGGAGTDFPAGTGVAVQPGSVIVLQMHYNLDQTPPPATPSDRSTLDLHVEPSVEHEAWLQPWLDPDWLDGRSMLIPAGAGDVTHFANGDLAGLVGQGAGVVIHGAALHMHQLGRAALLDLAPAATPTAPEPIVSIPRWDFHWQLFYWLDTPLVARADDQLRMQCHWDNRAENQPLVGGVQVPPRDVWWGDGSRDEMCLGVLYLTRAD